MTPPIEPPAFIHVERVLAALLRGLAAIDPQPWLYEDATDDELIRDHGDQWRPLAVALVEAAQSAGRA